MDKVQIIKIFGIPISLAEFKAAVTLVENLIQKRKSKFAAIVNVNTLNYAYQNKRYRQILQSADLILRDGTGVKWAVKKIGANPKYNFVGTDFIPDFFRITSKKQYRLFLLGARPGISESASKVLSSRQVMNILSVYQHSIDHQIHGIHSHIYGSHHRV